MSDADLANPIDISGSFKLFAEANGNE